MASGRTSVLWDARKARDFGIGSYVKGLLNALAAREEFELSALVRPGDEEVFSKSIRMIPSRAPHYSLRELVSIGRVVALERPHIFHAPHYVVPLFSPGKTVVTVHDLMHLTRPEHGTFTKRIYARVMLHRAVSSAARILVASDSTRAELLRFDPRAASKLRQIPYGLEERFFAAVPKDVRTRVQGEHRLTLPYVLFLGNDKPHKNLAGLLEAFARLRTSNANSHHLVLAGGAEERRAERFEAIRRWNLQDACRDLGVVPSADVVPLLSAADALVLPSFTEGFGLPALEAQAVGTPVVCSDRGGLREAAGDAALYVDPDRVEALVEALGRILTDAPLRIELVRRGRLRAEAFTWTRAAEMTSGLYRELMEKGR